MNLPLKKARITSPYGIERTIDGVKSTHKGIDFISDSGDVEVKTIQDGYVRGTFNDPNGLGNYVSIEHSDGVRALYCHLKEFKVKAGQMIKAGQVIGIEGTTGHSTGIHLHLELRDSPYLQRNTINVADYLGIKNQIGLVNDKELTKEEKIELIKKKVGVDDNTIQYMQFYRYGDALIDKLVIALNK